METERETEEVGTDTREEQEGKEEARNITPPLKNRVRAISAGGDSVCAGRHHERLVPAREHVPGAWQVPRCPLRRRSPSSVPGIAADAVRIESP